MLSKLLKYDFKDTARTIPFFYLITMIFAGMVLSAKTLGIDWFRVTSSILLLLLGIAVSITTFVVVVMRFHKNLYSNEGYLMFTLPVKSELLLASKTIVSFFWMIISYSVTVGSFYISLYGFGVTGGLDIVMDELRKYGMEKIIYLIIPMVILATLYLLSQIFFAVTLANRPAFHSMGAASAFLLFLATNVILQIVESIMAVFVPFSIELSIAEKVSATLTSKNMFSFIMNSMDGSDPQSLIIGLGGFVFEILMVVILFYVTSRNMKNKVSLK